MALLGFDAMRCRAQESMNGPEVNMVVTVEARHGNNPPAIDGQDVMVYEGKTRDKVSSWVPAQADRAQLQLFILIDDDSSMSVASQFDDIRNFITSQPAATSVGVAYMQNGIAQITQNLTADHNAAAKALRLPLGVPGINASPYFSLSDLIKRWPATNARREVIMISDGIDRYYGGGDLLDPYVSAAIEDAQRAGIIIYTIYNPGVGHFGHSYWLSYWGQLYLSQLSEETGAESYYIGFNGSAPDFTPFLDNINHHLTHQYWLTFTAKRENKAGMQRVRLMTEVPNAELVSAGHVYVPAGP
jgi:hypothetical protein